MKRFCPVFKVLCYYGSAERRKELRQGWSKANWHHVIITSYQLVVQDSNHKSYITFENIRDLMGRDAADSEDDLRLMWDESMNCYHIQNSQITYESFLERFVMHPSK